jgi:hypothetical protein
MQDASNTNPIEPGHSNLRPAATTTGTPIFFAVQLAKKNQDFSRITVIEVNRIVLVNKAKKPRTPAGTETNARFVMTRPQR